MSQDVSQCCQGLETGSDTQWSQHSSDCFRGAVYVGDDHSSVWGVLLSCWWCERERLRTLSGYPLSIKASLTVTWRSSSVLSMANVHRRFALRCKSGQLQPCGLWGGGIGSPDTTTSQYVLLSCRLWWLGSHQDGGSLPCHSSLTQGWLD